MRVGQRTVSGSDVTQLKTNPILLNNFDFGESTYVPSINEEIRSPSFITSKTSVQKYLRSWYSSSNSFHWWNISFLGTLLGRSKLDEPSEGSMVYINTSLRFHPFSPFYKLKPCFEPFGPCQRPWPKTDFFIILLIEKLTTVLDSFEIMKFCW